MFSAVDEEDAASFEEAVAFGRGASGTGGEGEEGRVSSGRLATNTGVSEDARGPPAEGAQQNSTRADNSKLHPSGRSPEKQVRHTATPFYPTVAEDRRHRPIAAMVLRAVCRLSPLVPMGASLAGNKAKDLL